MIQWRHGGTHTSELELVSRLYMYCNIVKLGVYVYHTRDMWMGPDRRCETGFFGIFYGTYCSPPPHPPFYLIFNFLIFCAIYTLKIQTINNCSKWWRNRLVHCQHHFMLWCWSLSGQENKQISWNWYKTTYYSLVVWCIRLQTDWYYELWHVRSR